MQLKRLYLLCAVFVGIMPINMTTVYAQQTSLSKVQNLISTELPKSMGIGKLGVVSINSDEKQKKVSVNLKENFAYLNITPEYIQNLQTKIKNVLSTKEKDFDIEILINGRSINEFLPITMKNFKGKEHFITPLDDNKKYSKGLSNDIIAMWQSHGWYFESKLNRWEWQRARIFQTVEDLYTQSYVMPFLMPMLENAGAYIISPRERDTNTEEIIVDNDKSLAYDGYTEINGVNLWENGNFPGFAYKRSQYQVNQNPFTEGSFRSVQSVEKEKESSYAFWKAKFPKAGEYAVYVSYATLPNSATDVVYTIHHKGGVSKYKVNQQMGGGTWIYLGHFLFDEGYQDTPVVTVSNLSKDKNAVVTADAVKIGGGMGNIARIVSGQSANVKSSEAESLSETQCKLSNIDYKYQLSKHPRYTEGARYWLQWAGIPDSIYTPSGNINDYTDDYKCRGSWVNYLAGGSRVLPQYKGLNIPVDLAFAFHSDAGTTMNDSIIGTLGIYCTKDFSNYNDGTPRALSRELTNMIMTNIVNDVRAKYEPNWTRRGMWDKSYFEAKVPEVPTMLLELLSHQNFADMKYGLDPTFRFTVSRAIYKGMLQFLAKREGRKYQVQPLPINSFAISKLDNNKFELTWKETVDTLTPGSNASQYIVMQKIGNGAFKQLAITKHTNYTVIVNNNDVNSYQIIAVNEGGRSFASETLALGNASNSKGDVLVVNGFTRISAPDTFDAGKMAGFYDEKDHGVPYIKDISFIGSQFEFRRNIPWMDDDAAGFGASRSDYETKVIAGNTLDYPTLHGESILKAGYSFVSCSVKAVEEGNVDLKKYSLVDLILGKQKETTIGRGAVANRYKAFTSQLQKAIKEFTSAGGNIFVSGAYVASDIWDNSNAPKSDKDFAQGVLGFTWRVGQAANKGRAYVVPTYSKEIVDDAEYTFSTELNEDIYVVESPDSFYPADNSAQTLMRYSENNLPAGIICDKTIYKTCIIGFPFETIISDSERDNLMSQVLNYLNKK